MNKGGDIIVVVTGDNRNAAKRYDNYREDFAWSTNNVDALQVFVVKKGTSIPDEPW